MNINARIHWVSFPGGSGRYENPFQAFDVKDGPPQVRLCTGEQFAI